MPSDFSGVGISRVQWRQSGTQALVQWSMNGSTITSTQADTFQGAPVAPDASFNVVATADFNGDGKTDLLWQRTDGSLVDWAMNGSVISASNFVRSQGQVVAPDASWSLAGTGDFDGDGRNDLLWRNTNGSLAEWQLNGSTITSSQTPTSQGKAVSPDSSFSIVAMGDFNGDGRDDILWRQSGTGALAEWQMNGSTIAASGTPTSQGNPVAPDASWSIIAAGDFNRDGMTDLLWRQAGTGLITEWQMNGTQIVASGFVSFQGTPVTPDASFSLVEIGDFNGDGKSDALWRQGTTGALAEWLMDGSQIVSSSAVTFQGSTPTPDSSFQVQSKPTIFA